MKLPALLLAGSLAANAALAGYYFTQTSPLDPGTRAANQARDAIAETRRVAANARVQAARDAASQAQLWTTLDSGDLRTLIARLRAAGFPAAIIRAIVSARIEASFSARMNALTKSVEDTPFWRPAPTNSFNNPKFNEERSQIYRDRARQLREVLGDDLFGASAGEATAAQRRQFGDLPKSKIDLVQRINDDYAEMISQARASTQGITLPEDREKLALLAREKRADLAAALTPQELEDYDLHSSASTTRMRSALTLMDASEAEFLTLFRIQQQFSDVLTNAGPGMMTADLSRQRRDATAQINTQIKAALGDARAADYFRASDYEFQNLTQVVQRENLPASAAVTAYDLRNSTSAESLRIFNDKDLTNDQKLTAMQTLAQSTRAQLTSALGPTAGATYAKSAQWLQAIERGTSVSFDGTTTMYRSLPPAGSVPPRN
jgi:hypothetical protein